MRTRLLGGTVLVVAVTLTTACGGGDGDLEAFCTAAKQTDAHGTLFADLEPTDVDAALATFREALAAEERLQDDAPDAVRSDIDVLVRFLDDVVEGLEAVDPQDDGRPAVYDELRPRFDQVEAASARVATYVEANC